MAQEHAACLGTLNLVESPTAFIGKTDFIDIDEEIFRGAELLGKLAIREKHIIDETELIAAARRAPALPENIRRRIRADHAANIIGLFGKLGLGLILAHTTIFVFFSTSAVTRLISLLIIH